MNKKAHTNKLSVYLIKSEYNKDRDILKDSNKLNQKKIKGIGNFYYGPFHKTPPSWIKNFFNNSLDLNLFNSNSKGVLLISSKKRIFCSYIWLWLDIIKSWGLRRKIWFKDSFKYH